MPQKLTRLRGCCAVILPAGCAAWLEPDAAGLAAVVLTLVERLVELTASIARASAAKSAPNA
jgi:hypothetical protein